jgi:hypothetical protein
MTDPREAGQWRRRRRNPRRRKLRRAGRQADEGEARFVRYCLDCEKSNSPVVNCDNRLSRFRPCPVRTASILCALQVREAGHVVTQISVSRRLCCDIGDRNRLANGHSDASRRAFDSCCSIGSGKVRLVMSQSEKSPIEAFREGLDARSNGRDLKSNPYEHGSIERFLWEGGWRTESMNQGLSRPTSDGDVGRANMKDA